MLQAPLGAAAGAVFGALTAGVLASVRRESPTWQDFSAAAAAGAVGGALFATTIAGGVMAQGVGRRVVGTTLVSTGAGVSYQTSQNLLNQRPWHEEQVEAALEGAAIGTGLGAGRALLRPTGQIGRKLWTRYTVALVQRPVTTKAASGAALSGAGDLLAQRLQASESGEAEIDWKRAAYMTTWGAASGAATHYWWEGLEKVLPGKAAGTVAKKVALDRLVWSPATVTAMVVAKAVTVDGMTLAEAGREIRDKVPTATLMGLPFWSGVHAANFAWTPRYLHVPVQSGANLVWSTVLSGVVNEPPGGQVGPDVAPVSGASGLAAVAERALQRRQGQDEGIAPPFEPGRGGGVRLDPPSRSADSAFARAVTASRATEAAEAPAGGAPDPSRGILGALPP